MERKAVRRFKAKAVGSCSFRLTTRGSKWTEPVGFGVGKVNKLWSLLSVGWVKCVQMMSLIYLGWDW